eukprot:Trichotokara_eunicae@DN9900_c0_g1_i1.p1
MEPLSFLRKDLKRALDDALGVARTESQGLRGAIKKGDLRECLIKGTNLLAELKASDLGARNYLDLYLTCEEEATPLGNFFAAERKCGKDLGTLYDVVQHAGAIIPRLYLTILVGAEIVKVQNTKGSEVLKIGNFEKRSDVMSDLMSLLRGVQHPLRGIFARHFLCNKISDALHFVAKKKKKKKKKKSTLR